MSSSPYVVVLRGKVHTVAGLMRCEALTARHTQCRHAATGYLLVAPGNTRPVCNLHWQHTPRRGWW